MNINRLCPGCMRERENTAGACPYCGFSAADNANDTRCLPINTILAGKYLIGKVLGQGGFGITYMGFDLNMEARVAIKEYFPVEVVNRDTALSSGNRVFALDEEKRETFNRGLEKFVTEARNIARLVDVPGVVSVKEFFRENDTAYIVMEYIDGMSLSDYLTQRGGRIPEWEALNIIHPIMDALEKVHGLGMIHRDISPDNIMLSFDNNHRVTSAKLIDFGSARVTTQDDQKSKTIILKHGYAPEEQYRTHGEQGTWTDVYAISAVLYKMLTGETPVSAMDRVLKDSLKGINQFPVQVSKNTEKAVMKGLAVKKNDRTQTIAELSSALYSVPVQPTPERQPKNITHIITERGGGHTHHTTSVSQKTGSTGITGTSGVPGDTAGTVSAGKSSKKVGVIVTVAVIAVLVIVGIIIAVATSNGNTESKETVEIVSWNPQTSYVASANHAVFLSEDGTVNSKGSNQYGQRNMEGWEDIAAVAAGDEFTAGLKSDGTIIIAGQLENSEAVEGWTDIIQLAVGAGTDGTSYLFGLKTDGTIVVNKYSESFKECLDLQNIKAITAYKYTFCALDEEGAVQCINKDGSKARSITGWYDVQYITCNMDVVMGLKTDGTVVGSKIWEDKGDFYYKWKNDNLEKLSELSNITQLSLSYGILYAVSSDGGISSVEYDKLTDEGKKQKKEITSYENVAGVVQTIDGVPASYVETVSKAGEITEYSQNYGTHTEETMRNLKSVNVIDGNAGGNAVLGITKSNNLIGYGTIQELNTFPSRSDEKIEKNVKDVESINYYDTSNGKKVRLNSFCYLDTSGRLWMKKYDQSISGYSGYQVVAEDITQISVIGKSFDLEDTHSAPFVAALTKNGKVKLISTDHIFKIPSNLKKAEDWKNISKVLCRYDEANDLYEIVGLKKDGTVTSIRSDGTKSETAKGWSNVKSIYGSTYAIGAVFKDGTVDFIKDESHDEGQYATYDDERWGNIKSLALGLYHTVGLTKDGEVVIIGRNDSGQCDLEDFDGKKIKSIAAGESSTIGITENGKMIMAGDIGW